METQTDLKHKIQTEFEDTVQQVLNTLRSFSQHDLNKVPFEGSWTAGQIGEHLFKSISGIVSVLNGKVTDTDRNPEEKEQWLKDMFLNYDLKFKSAETLLPSDEPKDKEAIINQLKTPIAGMKEAIANKNLTKTCLDLVVPGAAEFTRAEWCYLVNYHSQRHVHQLKNIKKNLTAM